MISNTELKNTETTIVSSNTAETVPATSTDHNHDQTSDLTNDLTHDLTLEFTRETLEKMKDEVSMTDTDEKTGLELFCSNNYKTDACDTIRKCRGVVFHGDNIIMRAFPYTIEYSCKNEEKIESEIKDVFEDCMFFDAHEGVLIRMFNFGGRWFTSTHRKLDAFRSKWSSKESFGTSFKNALKSEIEHNKTLADSLPGEETGSIIERFQTTLDVDKQYMFLVRHTKENRIVCHAPERHTVYHVGTFVDSKLVLTEDVNIPYPTKHNFGTLAEMVDHVQKTDSQDNQGIIVFAPNNKQYKILNDEYLELFETRGNVSSINFRYLQLRMDRNEVDKLYFLYPEKAPMFEEYEEILYAVAKIIYKAYCSRYINRQYVKMPQEEYAVMKDCHKWHEEDRKNNRISVDRVIDSMNSQRPTNLNRMIRHYRLEQKNAEQQVVSLQQPRSLLLANKKAVQQSVKPVELTHTSV